MLYSKPLADTPTALWLRSSLSKECSQLPMQFWFWSAAANLAKTLGFGCFAFVLNPSVLAHLSKSSAEQQGVLLESSSEQRGMGWACPLSHAWNQRLCQACLIGCESSFHKILVSGKNYSSALPWVNELNTPRSWNHLPLCQVSASKSFLLKEIKTMLLPCFFCKSQHLYTAVLPSTGSTKPFVHPAHPAIPM